VHYTSQAPLPITSSATFCSRRALRKSYPPCSPAREERAGRRTEHIVALRKRAAEADAKLKRLYDAIENGVADLADPLLKEGIAGSRPRAIRLRADAARAEGALDRLGSGINTAGPQNVWQDGPQAHGKPSRAATATTSVHSRSASKSMRKKFGSWGRKARFCAPSPPLQAQKRRVLPCPFCTEVAHPERFERPIPNSSFAGWHRAQPSSHDASDPNIVGRCWQDGMLGYRHASNLRHPLGVDEPMRGDKSAKRVPQSVPISFI
jgi:hypothetical protein